MGKAAAIVGVGAGGTAVAAGGNYALGDPIGSALYPKEEEKVSVPEVKETKTEEIPEEVDHHQCLESLFPDFDLEHESENEAEWRKKSLTGSRNIEQSFFSFTPGQTPKSCLSINWIKEKGSSDSKWEGDFSWLWAFSQGSKGIIWSMVASTTDKATVPLQLSGGIYFLKKGNDGWHVYMYKAIKTTTTITQKIDSSNFANKFPSVGSGITEKDSLGTDKDNWGFVSGADDLAKVRTTSPSEDASITKTWMSGWWEWKVSSGKETKKLTEWSSNSKTWINQLYRGQNTIKNIGDKFEKMKGNWTKKSLEGNALTSSS